MADITNADFLTGQLTRNGDSFVDGAVVAAARTLPTWSDRDIPPLPSEERKAVKELQEECQKMLAKFPTTSKEDQKLLGKLTLHFPMMSLINYNNIISLPLPLACPVPHD